jgi:hypothetical protein
VALEVCAVLQEAVGLLEEACGLARVAHVEVALAQQEVGLGHLAALLDGGLQLLERVVEQAHLAVGQP